MKGGKWLDTPDRRGSAFGLYSSTSSKRHHGNHCYHPYRRSEKQCFPNEIKKTKPPTFNREMKRSEDSKAWLLGMKNLFELHDYIENMKSRITIFNLKGKKDIWWEDVNHFIGIKVEELCWHSFKRLFIKKYLSEIYYDGKDKEFYEFKMGSMTY